MVELWTKNTEIDFFKQSEKFATPEKLFYKAKGNKYCAYWPKGYGDEKTTCKVETLL